MRPSAATARGETCNVGGGRIRIFLGPRLNVIFFGMVGCPRPRAIHRIPESRRRTSPTRRSPVNLARVLSLFIENAWVLLRLRTVNSRGESLSRLPFGMPLISPCLRRDFRRNISDASRATVDLENLQVVEIMFIQSRS